MSRSNGWAMFWALVAAILAGFGQELAAGHVPLPADLKWVVPIVVMAISALSPYIKRAAGQADGSQQPPAAPQPPNS